MCMTEETLDHLLGNATVLQFAKYPPNGLHIFFEGGAILTVYANEGSLDIDVMGPNVPERVPFYEEQARE
jgi:hypothetical protein